MGTRKRSLVEEIKLITEMKSELALPKLYRTWELCASARDDSVCPRVRARVRVCMCAHVCVCLHACVRACERKN